MPENENLTLYRCKFKWTGSEDYSLMHIAALNETEAKRICKRYAKIGDNDDFLEFYPTKVDSIIGDDIEYNISFVEKIKSN